MPSAADSDRDSDPRWTLLDRDGLADAYWDVVAPALRAEGRDPATDRPSHQWLSSHGFRGLTYALAEYHDTTFAAFWKEDLDTQTPGFEWGINHDATIDALEQYLDRQEQRLSWSDSTVATHRYRLARYVRAYEATHGTADVLTPVARESDVPAAEAVDECWAAFDTLDQDVSRSTLRRIYKTVANWYSTLVSRRKATFNPTEGLDYDWSADQKSAHVENPPLAPDDVRALTDAAADLRERLLVVALCAWGLRSSEVAALHRRQLHLDQDDAHVAFRERKNGPGTVAVIFGADVARERVRTLDTREDWNGYLFPSDRSSSGHRTRGTILDWFQDLADRAELDTVDGRRPTAQMARRFWYDSYSNTIEQLVENQISEIAEEQGSTSADVVWQDYLSESRRRQLRREFMRENLRSAFQTRD